MIGPHVTNLKRSDNGRRINDPVQEIFSFMYSIPWVTHDVVLTERAGREV